MHLCIRFSEFLIFYYVYGLMCMCVCSEHTHTYVFRIPRRPVASDSFGARVTHCELPDVSVGNSDHLLFLTTEPLFFPTEHSCFVCQNSSNCSMYDRHMSTLLER